jgi:hypothetical protein
MELGLMVVSFVTPLGKLVEQDVALLAGVWGTGVVFWGFTCPQCHRYARKLFLPSGRDAYLCRRCHKLRYISQRKLNSWARQADAAWDASARYLGFPSARMFHKIQTAGIASLGYTRL